MTADPKYKTVIVEHFEHVAAFEEIAGLIDAGYSEIFTMPATRFGRDAVCVYFAKVKPLYNITLEPMASGASAEAAKAFTKRVKELEKSKG